MSLVKRNLKAYLFNFENCFDTKYPDNKIYVGNILGIRENF